ncbi:MAG TPA: AAA family ATPase [Gaiellaceae bacterium]|nr:AAA family ATPase [Gaiellaceae bacterium]
MSVLAAVRKHPFAVAGTTAACLLVGLILGLVRAPTYTAKTQLYVQIHADDAAAVANVAEASAALAPAYSRLVHARAVVAPVAARLGMAERDVVSSVSASPIPVSPVVRVRGTSRSRERAVALANLTAGSLTRHVQEINRVSGSAQTLLRSFENATREYTAANQARLRAETLYAANPTAALRVKLNRAGAAAQAAQLRLETARARYAAAQAAPVVGLTSLGDAQSASSDKLSKLELLLFICLLGGLAIGIGAAVLLEFLAARVHTSEEMTDTLGLELLAAVPLPRKGSFGEQGLVMLQSPESLDAEAFRILRMNLELANVDAGARAFLFVSALKGEGKTTTACNVGAALALAGRRVVVVDCDVRQAAVARAFGLEGEPGLGDLVLHPRRYELPDVLARIHVASAAPRVNGFHRQAEEDVRLAGLDVLPVGERPEHPGEFVVDPRFGQVLAELKLRYEFVVIDSPPLLVVGDAMATAKHADTVVAVARRDYVSSRDLREFRRMLDTLPCRPLGFVLTRAPARKSRYSGYEPVQYRSPALGAREPVA